MPTLLEVRSAYKSYGQQILLDDVSVSFDDQQRVGLIGRNGAGKSTLARILVGDEELDRGQIVRHKTLRLGYLRQEDPYEPHETVLDFLMRDTGQPDWRCGQLAGRFEIKGKDLEGPMARLSGGWQARAKLTALLLHDPNLLLLDEPTNFLDLHTLMLLERFLRAHKGGCLIISHDRTFLRQTCAHTLELARGTLHAYPGPVDAYLKQKRQRQEEIVRANARVRAKQRQLQAFIDRNRAGANTASQAKNKQKQLDRLEIQELDAPESLVSIRLPAIEAPRGLAFECSDLGIGYPDHAVASDIRLELGHGERVAVVGDNGEGKTTFLRTITDSLPAVKGALKWGHGCEIGVYAQHVYQSLPQHLSVLAYLSSRAAPGTTSQTILDVAGSFLFRGDDVQKGIQVLSGGERARLCLAGLFLRGHNVLVLDEPANHLDVETTERLSTALMSFDGTVIFTSHDRTFMAQVATQVVEVSANRVLVYPGDYTLYVRRMQERIEAEALDPKRSAAEAATTGDMQDSKEQGRERYRLGKEITSVERQIARLQQAITEFDTRMATCEDWQAQKRLQDEKAEQQAMLTTSEERWVALHEELEQI